MTLIFFGAKYIYYFKKTGIGLYLSAITNNKNVSFSRVAAFYLTKNLKVNKLIKNKSPTSSD